MKKFIYCLILLASPAIAQWTMITPEGEEFYNRLFSDETLNRYLISDISIIAQNYSSQLTMEERKEVSLRTLEKIKKRLNKEQVKAETWPCVSKLEKDQKDNMLNLCVENFWMRTLSSIPYTFSETEAEYKEAKKSKELGRPLVTSERKQIERNIEQNVAKRSFVKKYANELADNAAMFLTSKGEFKKKNPCDAEMLFKNQYVKIVFGKTCPVEDPNLKIEVSDIIKELSSMNQNFIKCTQSDCLYKSYEVRWSDLN